jgi:hypothetical protein
MWLVIMFVYFIFHSAAISVYVGALLYVSCALRFQNTVKTVKTVKTENARHTISTREHQHIQKWPLYKK